MDQFLVPPLELKQAIEDVHDVGTDFTQSCRESLSLDLMSVKRLLEVTK
ncbi:MAG: hypothetical protein O3A95_10930 [Planctomycetota bacterium]|nr:hypothetical protein [Planctomycetota bacterium]